MINTHNLIDVFNSSVAFVLESIAEPSLYSVSEIRRFMPCSIFLLQLFNTWRLYNATHARDSN
jgi:hypothetical protein